VDNSLAIPGPVPGIHAFEAQQPKTWMAVTSTAMATSSGDGDRPRRRKLLKRRRNALDSATLIEYKT